MQRSLRIVAHLIGITPALISLFIWWRNGTPIDPVATYTAQSGDASLKLLLASLAITPLMRITGVSRLGVMRRPLGLYAFAYVMMHVLVYVWLDYAWDWSLMAENLLRKRYLVAGVVAATVLVPLALTSMQWWQRVLGVWWKRLHRIAYVAASAALVHYFWLVKSDTRVPLIYIAIFVALMLIRAWYWYAALRASRGVSVYSVSLGEQ